MTDPVPQRHDNQYTTPPLSDDEIKRRTQMLRRTGGKGAGSADRMALFAEWIHTEPAQFATARKWMVAKGHHPGTLQGWGGATFWDQAREAVRAKALTKAIEKSPDIIAKKYEKQFRIVGKLEDGIEKAAEKLLEPVEDAPKPPPDDASEALKKDYRMELRDYMRRKRASYATEWKTLAEAVDRLADTNLKLRHDGVQQHEVKSVNLHATIVQSLKDRDARFGIPSG